MTDTTTRSGIRLLPFSYSRLKDYERCPFYAYEVHVRRNRSPQSPQAGRGEAVHKVAEQLLNVKRMPPAGRLPSELRAHHSMFKELHASPLKLAEQKFGVTARWRPIDFFHETVWCRGVWDVLAASGPAAVRVVDHKTGRVYPEHDDQLRLYSVVALAYYPEAELAVAEAWYLDQGPDATKRFELPRADAGKVRRDFEARVRVMATDTELKPRPNQYCRTCHLNARNGGPCKEGR